MSETRLFPQLFEASGENYAEILDRLIQIAKEVHAQKAVLATSR